MYSYLPHPSFLCHHILSLPPSPSSSPTPSLLLPFPCSEHSLNKLREWLKQLPTNGVQSVTCGGEALDERQVMAIERIVDKFKEKRVITRELRGKRMDFKHLFRVCLYLKMLAGMN